LQMDMIERPDAIRLQNSSTKGAGSRALSAVRVQLAALAKSPSVSGLPKAAERRQWVSAFSFGLATGSRLAPIASNGFCTSPGLGLRLVRRRWSQSIGLSFVSSTKRILLRCIRESGLDDDTAASALGRPLQPRRQRRWAHPAGITSLRAEALPLGALRDRPANQPDPPES
jgi:hypothetical protein